MSRWRALFYQRTANVSKSLRSGALTGFAVAHLGYDIGDTPTALFDAGTGGAWTAANAALRGAHHWRQPPRETGPEASWFAVAADFARSGYGLVWLWAAPANSPLPGLAASAGGEVPPF